jgi:RNA polymerase sigma factor (sigma-70 family)
LNAEDPETDDLEALIEATLNADRAAVKAKMAELGPFVKTQYARILGLCRKNIGDLEEAAQIAHDSMFKFLLEINVMLVGTHGIKDPARCKFRNPEAWITRTTLNALHDFRRKRSRRGKYLKALPPPDSDGRHSDVVDGACEPFYGFSRNPEQQVLDREIITRYREALDQLSLPRRRAWVLCNDQTIETKEIEQLLELKSAAAAKDAWPEGMPLHEAALLLCCEEGTVSSNVTRAREDLKRKVADLDPWKFLRVRAATWGREFLVGAFGRKLTSGPPGLPRQTIFRGGSIVWTRPASDLIVDYARAISRPLPIPANQERVSGSAQEIDYNSRPRRANLPFPKGLKQIAYRCGSYRKGCRNCGETKHICTKSGRRRIVYTSGYAVFRAYVPGQTGWTFWCYECGAMDSRCWAKCKAELGRPAVIRPKSQFVYKIEIASSASAPIPITSLDAGEARI